MKIQSLVKLANRNIISNKKLFVPVAIILAVLFSFYYAFFLCVNEVKSEVSSEEQTETGGKILVSSNFCAENYQKEGDGACAKPEEYYERAEKLAKKYGGAMVGAEMVYTNKEGNTVGVILDKAAKYLKTKPTYFVPDDKIPVIRKFKEGDDKEEDGDFYIIGRFRHDAKLDQYLIMDNTKRVSYYLSKNGYLVLEYSPVIVFDDVSSAYNYFEKENCESGEGCELNKISELFTSSFNTYRNTKNIDRNMILIFFAVLFFTSIILVITILLAIRHGRKTTRLYRTLGATKSDMVKICVFEFIVSLLSIIVLSILCGLVISLCIKGGVHESIREIINRVGN